MYSVCNIANFFLSKAIPGTSWAITPLKLQKLVYYAQAWYLVAEGKPLYNEDIEAWDHGPVVPELYYKYRDYKYNEIPSDEDHVIDNEKVIEILNAVWNEYGGYNGKYLEQR